MNARVPPTKPPTTVGHPETAIDLRLEPRWSFTAQVVLGTAAIVAAALAVVLATEWPAYGAAVALVGVLHAWIVAAALSKQIAGGEPALPVRPADFTQYNAEGRKAALDFAWRGHGGVVPQPALPPRRGPVGPWLVALLAAFIIVPVAACLTPGPSSGAAQNAGTLASVAFALVVAWWVVGVAVAIRSNRTLKERIATFGVHWNAYVHAAEREHARELARQWVYANVGAWIDASAQRAATAARQRFGVEEQAGACFVLHGLSLEQAANGHAAVRMGPADMPPYELEMIPLIVGNFLGRRVGHFLLIADTSYSVAVRGGDIVEQERSPNELEWHYRDIITVEYQRDPSQQLLGQAAGLFTLSLTNGQPIQHRTLEHGAASCVDAIRRQTRAAKLGTH